MTAPKRIIMDFGYTPTADGVALLETWSKPVEYTRTDLIQPMIDAAVASARVDGMRAAMEVADQVFDRLAYKGDDKSAFGAAEASAAIAALIAREGGE